MSRSFIILEKSLIERRKLALSNKCAACRTGLIVPVQCLAQVYFALRIINIIYQIFL